MKWIKLKHQRGAALLLSVMVVAALISFVLLALGFQVDALMASFVRQRNQIAGLQVLQDFAVLAREANDRWVAANPGVVPPAPGSCPGMTQSPTSRPFCWNSTANTECVRSPMAGEGATGPVAKFCLSGTTTVGSMTVAEITAEPPTFIERWKYRLHNLSTFRHELVAEFKKELANAVIPAAAANLVLPPWMPGLAGAPSNNITFVNCMAAAALSANCKPCATAAPTAQCLELRVCMNYSGSGCSAADPTQWYRQEIAILPR